MAKAIALNVADCGFKTEATVPSKDGKFLVFCCKKHKGTKEEIEITL
jgi:hypothetical protein